MKVAALDLGSNTFLLLVAEVEQGKVEKVYADHVKVVRLGQDLQKNGYFCDEALARAEACLKEFRDIINIHKPQKVLAMATSAARDATNSDRLKKICRDHEIPLEIISGSDEAQVTFNGAMSFSLPSDHGVVIDIGGGSTELIYGNIKTKKISFAKSYDIGCVRLTEKHVTSHPISAMEVGQLEAVITKHLLQFIKAIKIHSKDPIVAVAGTPTSLAAAEFGGFDPEKIDGYKISQSKLKDWSMKLSQASVEERIKQYGIEPGRADVIVVGALTLWILCKLLDKEEIIVSTRGVRYGVALKMDTH